MAITLGSQWSRATIGHLRATEGHLRATKGHLRATIGVTRVSFHTGTGNIVPRLVTDLTDFFGENKEFSMILGKKWNF